MRHSRETADAAEALWTLLGKPEWRLQDIADVIHNAEERGRRRGDTERDELRALLRDCATAIRNSLHGADDGALFGMQARIDAAIAPRDSGKVET